MRSPAALIVVALLLAASVVVSALIVTRGIREVRLLGSNRIEVTGSAERQVRSDQVKWVASTATTVDADALDRGYRDLARELDAVRAVLSERGFEAGALTVAPVEAYGIYRECYGGTDPGCVRELVGYELRQRLTLNSERVDDATALAQDALAFSDAGAPLFTESLQYFTSELAALRPALLADALADAQLRAGALAAATGAEIGPLQAVDSGVFQVTQVNSTDVSALGEYDTSAIDKKISAVVRATFALR